MKITQIHGVPGAMKTSQLPGLVNNEIQSGRQFQLGDSPPDTALTAYTNQNTNLIQQRFAAQAPIYLPASINITTTDSWIRSQYSERSDVDFDKKHKLLSLAAWMDVLVNRGQNLSMDPASPDFDLFRLIKNGPGVLSEGKTRTLYVDESNDIKPANMLSMLAMQYLGKIEDICFLGDGNQMLYKDAVALPGMAEGWPFILNLKKLYELFHTAFQECHPLPEMLPVERWLQTYRLSKSFLQRVEGCGNSFISKLFTDIHTEIGTTEVMFGICKNISAVTDLEMIENIQIGQNYLHTNQGSIINTLEALRIRTGRTPLSVFSSEAIRLVRQDLNAVMVVKKARRVAGLSPEAEAMWLAQLRLHDDGSRLAGAFKAYVTLYASKIRSLAGKGHHPGCMSVLRWIEVICRSDDTFIQGVLRRYGLISVASWEEIFAMHVDGSFYEAITPELKIIPIWTVYKAKGQTFRKGSLFLADSFTYYSGVSIHRAIEYFRSNRTSPIDPLMLRLSFNVAYTALSRSMLGTQIVL